MNSKISREIFFKFSSRYIYGNVPPDKSGTGTGPPMYAGEHDVRVNGWNYDTPVPVDSAGLQHDYSSQEVC